LVGGGVVVGGGGGGGGGGGCGRGGGGGRRRRLGACVFVRAMFFSFVRLVCVFVCCLRFCFLSGFLCLISSVVICYWLLPLLFALA
jgi:hypothetical protein